MAAFQGKLDAGDLGIRCYTDPAHCEWRGFVRNKVHYKCAFILIQWDTLTTETGGFMCLLEK